MNDNREIRYNPADPHLVRFKRLSTDEQAVAVYDAVWNGWFEQACGLVGESLCCGIDEAERVVAAVNQEIDRSNWLPNNR